MSRQFYCRLSAVVIITLIITADVYPARVKYYQMGKDAYLQKQSERYDKFYSRSPSWGMIFTGWFILSGVGFGVYEAIAYGLCRIAKVMEGNPPELTTNPPGKDNKS